MLKWKTLQKELSLIDKLLPGLIILSIIIGIIFSVYVPSSREAFKGTEVVGVSVPLAVGMIVMMVPPLCKVQWENFFSFFSSEKYLRPILISLVLNWIVCPFLMFGLAWLTLFDQAEFRTGIIMIGLGRCIAMVLLWNDIAGGSNDLCAIIVLINSLLQLVLYAPFQLFFCYVITGSTIPQELSYSLVAKSLAFFLGVPLGLGIIIRFFTRLTIGMNRVLPFISPFAPIGLLYTIIVIFIQKGSDFLHEIGPASRCFIPLSVYFVVAWFGTFFFMRWFLGRKMPMKNGEEQLLLCGCEKEKLFKPNAWKSYCSASYQEVVTQSFTAASNNFELSLSVAISLYGSGSKQAIAATFGPLLEIPILLILCGVSIYFKNRFLWLDVNSLEDAIIEIPNAS